MGQQTIKATRAQGVHSPSGPCARVAWARKLIASASSKGKTPVTCQVALMLTSVAMIDLGDGATHTRRRKRQGRKGCAAAVAQGAVEVAALLAQACGAGQDGDKAG